MRPAVSPPGGSADRNQAAGNPPEGGNGTGAGEDVGGLRVEREPPDEQLPRCVELEDDEIDKSGRAERRLVGEHGGRPLRGGPQAADHQQQSGADLDCEGASRRHPSFPPLRMSAHRRGSGCGRRRRDVNGETLQKAGRAGKARECGGSVLFSSRDGAMTARPAVSTAGWPSLRP